MADSEDVKKGKGAQINTANPYLKTSYVTEHFEGLDEEWDRTQKVQIFIETPKNVLNKVDSPDLGLMRSINPYQGCEHGCIYCYARNSHQYWGFSAGLDFEQKIIAKPNAPEVLKKTFDNPRYSPEVIMLSGNTDCYQPQERKMQITRKLLQVMLEYRHPVSMITKNALILRDLDILKELAKDQLVTVSVSITSLSEELRLKLEPRTATARARLKVIEELSKAGIPVNVMVAPVIPSLNSHEIAPIIKEAAERGAVSAGYTIVRLNGSIAEIFSDWIYKAFPDRAERVLNQIKECHGGTLNESRWGIRMKGEGNVAASIQTMFSIARRKYMEGRTLPELDLSLFSRPKSQLSLF